MLSLQKIASIIVLCLWAQLALSQLAPRATSSLNSGNLSRPIPLPLQQAFPYYVSEAGPQQLRVTWNPAPGHYLYRHAFQFSLTGADADATETLEFSLPDGLQKTDEFFGEIEAYYGQVSAEIDLRATETAAAVLIIEYQGCADWGFCYPPQRQEFKILP